MIDELYGYSLGTNCVPLVQGHIITSYTLKLLTKCGRMWHLGGTGAVLTQLETLKHYIHSCSLSNLQKS